MENEACLAEGCLLRWLRLWRFRRVQARTCWGRRLLLHVLVLGLVPAATGEDVERTLAAAGYTARHWTVEDGLPLQNVSALAQTLDGFLWCGTADGLARFDGEEFEVYLPHEVPELAGFQIKSLHADRRGRLWIVDQSGRLAVREGARFRRFSPDAGGPETQAGAILESPTGEIWMWELGTSNFHRWVTNRFMLGTTLPTSLPADGAILLGADGPAWAVLRDRGQLIEFTKRGAVECELPAFDKVLDVPGSFLQLTNGQTGLITSRGLYVEGGSNWLEGWVFASPIRDRDLRAGCFDPRGNLWVGTSDQGLILVSGSGRYQPINLPGQSPAFPVNDLLRGREGNVWVATKIGLFRISCNVVRGAAKGDPDSIKAAHSIAVDRADGVWVAEEDRLIRVDPASGDWKPTPFIAEGRKPWRIAAVSDHGVWLATAGVPGTAAELWHVTETKAKLAGLLAVGQIDELLTTRAGELLVGTTDGLFQWDGAGFKSAGFPAGPGEARVNALVEDRLGRLYASVAGVGLFRREIEGWKQLTTRADEGSDRIQAFCVDEQNTLWIAADRPGLARWKDERWSGVPALVSELPRKVRALTLGDGDSLWLSSRWGLVRADRKELNQRADFGTGQINSTWLDTGDGLPSIDCAPTASGLARDSRGRLWIATTRGIGVMRSEDWQQHLRTRVPPRVHIDRVTADDLVLSASTPGEDLANPPPRFVVPPGALRVEIRFNGINLSGPEKLRFRYRLVGFDDGWVAISGQRLVHYTRLPVGEYRFELLAINYDGMRSREATVLTLSVQPEWWQRDTVRGGAGLCLLGAIWFVAHYRLKRLQVARRLQSEFSRRLIHSQEQERKRIAGELHDSLGQNLLVARNLALTGVKRNETNPAMAKLFDEISETLSTALGEARAISKELRPPELDRVGLTNALRGMVQRAGAASGISCNVNMDDIDGLLPGGEEINLYRLVQEGMNNIVKHSHATSAWVEVRHEPDHLAILVSDDGKGFDISGIENSDTAHSGTGIPGMKERTRLAGGEFDISSRPGSGTSIRIQIPVKPPQP